MEGEKDDLKRQVEELTVENEALMWGGEKENSPETKGRTFVKDEGKTVQNIYMWMFGCEILHARLYDLLCSGWSVRLS